METSQSSTGIGDDGYIDMDIDHICHSISSPSQQIGEFEFQLSSASQDKEITTSPADELFYKGTLLPLHLPPRLQMVQKLLLDATSSSTNTTTTFENRIKEQAFEENHAISFIPTTSTSTTTNTTDYTTSSTTTNSPLESCSISPIESCRVSGELNPDEYFFEWSSTEINSFIGDQPKKSWTTKVKKSSMGQKLKASSVYLKSLFTKSTCADESRAKAKCNAEEVTDSTKEVNEFSSSSNTKYMKVINNKKNPFVKNDNYVRYKKTNSVLKSIERDMAEDGGFSTKRRSFSGAIPWHSATKCFSSSSTSSSGSASLSSSSSSSSSSFSFSSNNGFYDLQFLKRSGSASSEIESSIEGAIAHCKRSQELFRPRKTASEVGVCSFPDSGLIPACGGSRKA